jgi:hypothetical protein
MMIFSLLVIFAVVLVLCVAVAAAVYTIRQHRR